MQVSFTPRSFYDRIISFQVPYRDVTLLFWYGASSYLLQTIVTILHTKMTYEVPNDVIM